MNTGFDWERIHADLRRPFQVHEHGFVNGRPYIKKDAIRRRLSQIDPLWAISPASVVSITNNVVVMSAVLTVCEAHRSDAGTGIIQTTGKDGKTPLPEYEVSRNTAKAFKTAVSDLLPRCAMQFGVGEYLKDAPRNVSDERSLSDWLRTLTQPNPTQQQQPTTAVRVPPIRREEQPQVEQAAIVPNPMAEAFSQVAHLYDMVTDEDAKKDAFRTDVKHLQGTGKLTAKPSVAEIVSQVKLHLLPQPAGAVGK